MIYGGFLFSLVKGGGARFDLEAAFHRIPSQPPAQFFKLTELSPWGAETPQWE